MEEEEEIINIYNNIEGISEEYKINSQQELSKEKENLELVLGEEKDKIRINAIIKENYIIIVYANLKDQKAYTNPNVKKIALTNFGITIIKTNIKDKKKNQEININFPLKGGKDILKTRFCRRNFYFNDFILINDSNNYLIVYLFSQLNIFKIHEKDGKLIYQKIIIKNFDNKEKNFRPMYLGSNLNKNKNILEISLLLKPENTFLFISIDTEKNRKREEYKIDLKNYNNILSKSKRSYCDKFLFADKDTNQKYILYKDDEKKGIIVKELDVNNIWDNPTGNEFYYLYNIENKTYFLAHIPEKSKEEEDGNNISDNLIIGIYNIIYDKEIDKYKVNLSQKIKIKNEDKIKDNEILFNINLENCISINMKEKLFFININKKDSVDSINIIILNSKDLEISRIFSEKYQEWSLIVSFIQEEKIYFSKFCDDLEKIGKCFINFEKTADDGVENQKQYEKNSIENNNSIETFFDKNHLINSSSLNSQNISKWNVSNISTDMTSFLNGSSSIQQILPDISNSDITITDTTIIHHILDKTKNDDTNEKDNEIENEEKIEIEKIVQNIISNRMKMNYEKLLKLQKEKEKKLEMIKEDIECQNNETKKLEKKINILLNHIKKLDEIKKNSNEEEEEEEEEEKEKNINYNYKKDYKKGRNNNNMENNYNNFKNNPLLNNQNKKNQNNNLVNNIPINYYPQMNQQQQLIPNIFNQYKLKNQNMNEQRMLQLLLNQKAQQQQRNINMINQGNLFLPNNFNMMKK